MPSLNQLQDLQTAPADQLAAVFAQFGPAFMKWLHAGARGADTVSFPRLRLLHALHTEGPQIMSSLSGRLGVTPRSVTALVDGLEQEGLARRTPHPTDRRATIIELTERGAGVVHAQFTAHRTRAAALFEQLDADDQRDLLRIMGTLTEALRDAGATEGCALALPPS